MVGLESRRECSGNGYGRFGRRPSSIRGIRESMASSVRRGNDEKRSGWMRDWRVRVWWVRCDVMDEWAVMSLGSKLDICWKLYLVTCLTYRIALFSIPLCPPRSRSDSIVRLMTWSFSLPLFSMPRRARLSISAIWLSKAGEISADSSRSESFP